jgi:hypothetical protein
MVGRHSTVASWTASTVTTLHNPACRVLEIKAKIQLNLVGYIYTNSFLFYGNNQAIQHFSKKSVSTARYIAQ